MMFGVVAGGDGGVAQQLRAPLNPEPAGGPGGAGPGAGGPGFTSLSSLREAPRSFWQRVKGMQGETLMRYLRYLNVLLAALQALAGFLGLFDLVVLDLTSFLISAYAIVFALLLLAFECRLQSMEPWIRQQFGFLFTYRGRTAFIFCVGFMDFGIDSALGFCVGVLMCANAVLNLLVLMYHPDFCNGTLAGSMDPTASYNSGLDETERLLAENQGMAARAGAFVLHEAQDRPELAQKMARAYAENQGYIPPPRH